MTPPTPDVLRELAALLLRNTALLCVLLMAVTMPASSQQHRTCWLH